METKNMVVLIGRLVAEPELRYMPNGQPVANFSLAVNRSIRKDDGSFEDSLDGYFDCELPHPPGACHPDCPGAACLHCIGPTNTCYRPDPDCMDECTLCLHCEVIKHWVWLAVCVLTCYVCCDQRCAGTYCCDYVDSACCWDNSGGIPIPHCV